MNRFPVHDPASASGRAGDLLAGVIERNGDAGDMVRTMAGSPTVLAGYLDLSAAAKRAGLDRRISERIALAVQTWIGCAKCLAAHTDAAARLGLSSTEISLATQGTSQDARIAAMVAFGLRVLVEPASISASDIDELRSLGYDDREILDVVALVALQQLTGSFNLVAGLEP